MTPGYENILGAALATNSVTVNGGLADRKGEYFHREISVANTGQPVWQNVTNISGSFTNKGGLLVPASSQVLTYDADGNLSSDSIWTYQWDAENRLVSMWMTNNGIIGITPTNLFKLDFVYDFMGRRMQKIVSTNNGVVFVPQSTSRFVYDGWNLLAIINPQSSILQSFMWGQDLSGTMTKAGGVSGLLTAGISGTNCFAAYDGNGNITVLINAADKSLAARYEYSPYGELLRETGLLARQNPFRFSTKFWDDESGLICYPYRYYSPSFGRWLTHDPSGEPGSLNLFLFALNNPYSNIDPDGKDAKTLLTVFVMALKIAKSDDTDLGAMYKELNLLDKSRQAVEEDQSMRAAAERAGALGGPLGEAEGIVAGIVATEFLTVGAIMVAACQDALGAPGSSNDYASCFYRDCKSGSDGGYADLDAALAALQLSAGSTDAGLNADAALGMLLYAEDFIGN